MDWHCPFSRTLRLLLFFFLLYWPVTGLAVEGRSAVRIGVYDNPPKVSCPEPGKAAGIFIDIIEQIARAEGWTLDYICGTWAEGLDRLDRGEIDLMTDVAYTAQRGERYSFHKVPVLSSWFQVYAPKGSGIRCILDLDGKRVAVLHRSVQQEAFEQMADGFGLRVPSSQRRTTAPSWRWWPERRQKPPSPIVSMAWCTPGDTAWRTLRSSFTPRSSSSPRRRGSTWGCSTPSIDTFPR